MKKEDLVGFEDKIKELWERGELPPCPIHFSGGNENELIDIFKEIRQGDDIFSTHRSHYHYLLAGGSPEKLEKMIFNGESMHIYDRKLNFFTSAIVSGCCGIAAGVAIALKMKGSKNRVWCFVGDGGEDEGHFYEAVRYVDGWKLPCTFVIEDNNRSVETPREARYGESEMRWPNCVKRYHYNPTYPHVNTGKIVNFKDKGVKEGNTWM